MRMLPFIIIFAVGGLIGMIATRTMVDVAAPDRGDRSAFEGAPEPAAAELTEEAEPVHAVLKDTESAVGESLLSRAIEEIVPPDSGEKIGQIRGEVLTIDGRPLPEVEITATPGQRPDREEGDDLETKVRRFVRDEQWRESIRVETTTGPDGQYLLAGLADQQFGVSAKANGYKFERQNRKREVRPGDVVNFTATPVAQLDVTILRADGTEPDSASVRIQRNQSSWGRTWSPKERVIDTEPGTVMVSASVGETERGEPIEITVEIGTGPMPVTIRLHSRGAIHGSVVFPADELESQAVVYLLPASLIAEPEPEDMFAATKNQWLSRSVEFKFDDLDPGTYWVGAARGNQNEEHPPTIQRVDVADSVVEITVAIDPIQSENGVRIFAYAPNGGALPDVSLSFGYESDQGSRWGGGTQAKLRDGGVILLPDADLRRMYDENQKGHLFVRGEHSAYGEQRLEISGFGGGVDLRFEEPARVVVAVLGYLGSDLIGRVQITLQPESESSRGWYGGGGRNNGVPDANSEVRLGPFSPGSYVLNLSYVDQRRNRWSSGVMVSQPVQVVSGENRLSIAVPPTYSLEIRFPEGTQSGSIQISPDGDEPGRNARHEQFEGGVALIEGLVAGPYQLRAWGNGVQNGTVFVDVPSSGPVYYEPAPINALRIRVSDEGGPLAQAGFLDGDTIIKINGQSFEGEEQLALMGVFLQGAEKVRLTLDRNGEEVELEVDPRGLMKGNPGGSFSPVVN